MHYLEEYMVLHHDQVWRSDQTGNFRLKVSQMMWQRWMCESFITKHGHFISQSSSPGMDKRKRITQKLKRFPEGHRSYHHRFFEIWINSTGIVPWKPIFYGPWGNTSLTDVILVFCDRTVDPSLSCRSNTLSHHRNPFTHAQDKCDEHDSIIIFTIYLRTYATSYNDFCSFSNKRKIHVWGIYSPHYAYRGTLP